MRRQWSRIVGIAVLLSLSSVGPASAQTAEEFQRRRADLREAMEPDQVLVLRGRDSERGRGDFRQDDDFFYLTGMTQPGGALLVRADGAEILFAATARRGRRTAAGARPSTLELAGAVAGIETLQTLDTLDGVLEILTGSGAAVLPEQSARRIVHRLRRIKSPLEIQLLCQAIDITCAAHREAMRTARPGMAEYQLQAVIEHVFAVNGAERPGFSSIVGSGPNACILHWSANTRRTEPGDVVVMDIGAEYRMYTADVTRTIPIGGKFTDRQRAVYEVVLAANEAAIEMVAPGVEMRAISSRVDQVLMEGLVRIGLLEKPDRQGLRQYYYHGLSHPIGLTVHDVGGLGTLEPGMVITIEPGLYLREEAMGFRIEDDVLVTETGHVVLSAAAPKTVVEVEATMAEQGLDLERYLVGPERDQPPARAGRTPERVP